MMKVVKLQSKLYETSARIVILNFPHKIEDVEELVNKSARKEGQVGDWKVVEDMSDWI